MALVQTYISFAATKPAKHVLFIPAGVPHKTLISSKGGITYVLVKTPK
jgi:uncharacterized RmlC-like cupin family protein